MQMKITPLQGRCSEGTELEQNGTGIKTVPKRKRPGEFSAAPYADENISPAGAL